MIKEYSWNMSISKNVYILAKILFFISGLTYKQDAKMLFQDTQKLWQYKMSLLKTVLSTSDNNINESKIKDTQISVSS